MPRTKAKSKSLRRQPRQSRSADTLAVLLDATEQVIVKLGPAKMTTNHVAERAGVAVGTLYRYFPSKEAMIEAAIQRVCLDEVRALESCSEQLGSATLAETIETMTAAVVGAILARPDFYARWYGSGMRLDAQQYGRELTERVEHLVMGLLHAHRDEVRVTNATDSAKIIVEMTIHFLRLATVHHRERLQNGAITREITDMISRYLLR